MLETFRKSSWYQGHSVTSGNVFNTSRTELHRRLRRVLSGSMSETSLAAVAHVQTTIDLMVKRVGEEMENRGAADVIKWFMFMATGIIGELSFGESFLALEIGEHTNYTKDLAELATSVPFALLFRESLRWQNICPSVISDVPSEARKT